MIAIPLAQAGGANADEMLSALLGGLWPGIAIGAAVGFGFSFLIVSGDWKKGQEAKGCLFIGVGVVIGAIIGAAIWIGVVGAW